LVPRGVLAALILTLRDHECRRARYGLQVMSRAAVVTLVLALLAPRVSDACDEFIIESKVFEFASRGSVLVVFHAAPTKGPAYEAPLIHKNWKFKLANKRAIAPKVKLLAPGLAVLSLPSGIDAGVLVDGEKRIAELDAIDEDEPRLEEPHLRSVVHESTGGKFPVTRVTVEVVGRAPRTAVAIVLATEDGEPITFGMIEAGQPMIAYERKDCGILPKGTTEPTVGMKVKAFWVDQFGRVSARSEAKRVMSSEPPPKTKDRGRDRDRE
jgi:hypothetical protein